LDFNRASSLKQQSEDRHVAPLGHILLKKEATNTNFIVFGLTRFESQIHDLLHLRQAR
jgi:hypothetical protein